MGLIAYAFQRGRRDFASVTSCSPALRPRRRRRGRGRRGPAARPGGVTHGQSRRHRPGYHQLGHRRWEGGQPTSSPTPRAPAPPRRWWRSPRTGNGWWASWPGGRRSSIRRAPSTRPSGSSAASSTRSRRRPGGRLRRRARTRTASRGSRSGASCTRPRRSARMILRKLADDAGRYLGEKVTEAVITVPAYFNDAQRTRPRTPAGSPGSRCCGSSTSRPRRRWPTGWTSRSTRRCWSSTSAAARSTSACSTSATAWSRSGPRRATPTWAATTSTGGSWTTSPTSSRRRTASTCGRTRRRCSGCSKPPRRPRSSSARSPRRRSTCPSSPRTRPGRSTSRPR